MFLSTYWDDFGLILIPKIIAITSSIVAVTVITDYFSLTSFGTLPGRDWSHPDRAAGVIAEPNFAAGLLAISLPFFVYFLSVKDQSLRSRIPHLIGIIMTISAIYFTGSRMGILLVMFFIVGVVIIHRDILMKTPLIVPTLVALPVGLYVLTVLQPTTIQRFTRLISYLQGGVGDGSIRERIDLIIAGIDMVEKNLLTGVGPGNFINAIVNYSGFDSVRYSHNTYINVASQIGIIGFFSFLLLLTYIFKRLLYIGHNDLSAHYILSYLILLGYLLFLSNFFSTYLWFVFIPLSITIENNMGIHR
jgi:O-antigen ligase